MKDFLVKSYYRGRPTSKEWPLDRVNSYAVTIYLNVTNDTDNDYSKPYEKVTSHHTAP